MAKSCSVVRHASSAFNCAGSKLFIGSTPLRQFEHR